MDIRGIYYKLKEERPWVRLPSRKYYEEETPHYFLFLSFCSAEKNKRFVYALQHALRDYLKKEGVINKSTTCYISSTPIASAKRKEFPQRSAAS